MGARFHFTDEKMSTADHNDFYDAIDFFAAIDMQLDDWQAEILQDWLALDESGDLVASTCGLSVPRQNGKSHIIELRILFGILFLSERILFSAHEVRSAKEIFTRLIGYFEDDRFPDLKESVRYIRRANGQEEISLKNGGVVKFLARSKGAGRGFTVDTIIFDEAQQLDAAAVSAMSPTMNTSKRGQLIYAGTPPFDAIQGEEFTRFRNEIMEGNYSNKSWMEFSADSAADIDSEETWAAANPAVYAGRIGTKAIVDNRARLSEEQFKREILGMWDTREGASVIDMEHWAELGDSSSVITSKIVASVDISPARTTGTISVAGFTADGRAHVEVVENRNDTGWILPLLIKMRDKQNVRDVVIDGGSPAGSLIDDLRRHKFKVEVMGSRDAAAAAGQFVDAVNTSSLVHLDQPVLNQAVGSARKRKLADSFAFARAASSSDITPLVACSQAAWGAARKFKARIDKDSSTTTTTNRVMVFKW